MADRLHIDRASDATCHWLTVRGDLDHASAPLLAEWSPPHEGPATVVVDLTGCTFLDSGGIRAILGQSLKHDLTLVCPPGKPARLTIDLVGLSGSMPVVESPAEAGRSRHDVAPR